MPGRSKNTDLVLRAEVRTAVGDTKKQPTFEIEAYSGGAVSPDSPYLDAQMVIDLASATSKDRITAISDHDDTQIVGQTDEVEIGESTIRMSGKVTGDWTRPGEPAEKIVTHARNGFVWPVSLGGSIGRLKHVEPDVEVEVNGRTFTGPLYVARNLNLRHVSFLSDAADQDASAKIVAKAAKSKEYVMDFDAWLAELGFDDSAALSDQQGTALRKKYDLEVELAAKKKRPKRSKPPVQDDGDDDEGDDDAQPVRARRARSGSDDPLAEAKARRKRTGAIRALMTRSADDFPEMLDAIERIGSDALKDETITLTEIELRILRESQLSQGSFTPTLRTGNGTARVDNRMLEVALCRMAGISGDRLVKQYGEQPVEMAERQWRNGLSLRECLEFTARAHGFSGSLRSETESVLTAAFGLRGGTRTGMQMGVGPSTYDVSEVLSSVLNRIVVNYFEGVDLTALRAISSTRPVTDFRQVEAYSMTGDLTFTKIPPGGEITHGTVGAEKYTNKAETYGRLLGIDRRDLINDDIGAFTSIGQRMGRGGALALAAIGWAKFMDNAAFFAAGNNNFLDGADTALSLASLTAAKTLFNKQTDPNGNPMNTSPRMLLVPPELEDTAKTILNSQLVVIAGTTDSTIGSANVHAGTLDLAMGRELSNSNYTGYSALKWYLLADPMTVPVLELCFLNGIDRPTVESAQFDFNRLGIAIRGYFDFGAAQHEHRGGVAMKGEV